MKSILTVKQKIALFIGMMGIAFSVFALDFSSSGEILASDLPKEAQVTLALIQQGGSYPFDQDGKTFGNYERQLPKKERGYYREYTVKKAKARSRGAQRIVTGGYGNPPLEYFYTSDHYNSFKQITNIK